MKTEGALYLIGGSEDKEGDCTILADFVKFAGGTRSRIVVMTAATDVPEDYYPGYIKAFKKLGVKDVVVVDVSEREDAESDTRIKAMQRATGIFFTGGDQLHITCLLGSTTMERVIRARWKKGLIIAGTSAGAAMMADDMFISGLSATSPSLDSADLNPGMDFLHETIVDTHFSQRARFNRLRSAVARNPRFLGIGVDENTAARVEGTRLNVIGQGVVTIVDASQMTYTNLHRVKPGVSCSLFGVKTHDLSAGHGFDLTTREPLRPQLKRKNTSRK